MDINFNTGPVRHELLQVADAVAREKSIDRDAVLEAMEQAIQTAGRRKYGQDHDIRATIDRKTGEIRLYRYTQVVDEVEDEATQMSVADARHRKPDAVPGRALAHLQMLECSSVSMAEMITS